MLEIIEKLAESITPEQKDLLKDVLGDDYSGFEAMLSAKSKSRIEDQLAEVKAAFKKAPALKLLKLHGEMSPEQRDLLNELL
jgi:hypothetical protein